MNSAKSLEDNLDDFQKLVIDLTDRGEELGDNTQAILLLNSLPDSYKDVKNAIKYGRENVSLDDVIAALRIRDLEIRTERKGNGDGLYVNARSEKKYNKKGKHCHKNKQESQSNKKVICYFCNKEGDIRRFCKSRLKKLKENGDSEVIAAVAESEVATALMMSSIDDHKDWILDSAWTYHMTPRRD
ncbi:hypothetical protein Patl1_06084 [Pistacia atlantica]|uniref:Uncharacterized protein n=1 Tax=Pistacia atlantica TaxID=434234 RepID=A0ACC1BT42_9ROSI|nr:hypothetical protein Patl1_06084 [Pistacia atlantica]